MLVQLGLVRVVGRYEFVSTEMDDTYNDMMM